MVLAHLVSGVVGSGLRALLVLALEVSKVPSTQNTPKERIMSREAVIVGSVRTGLTKAHRGSFNMTAGNASQLSDGASATLVMSADRAKQLGIEPMGIYRGSAVAGCGPDEMGIGRVFAVPKLLKHHGLTMKDIEIVELNEAFASQLLCCQRELEIPDEKLNPCGGSISIGHPFGMTG